MTSTTFLARYPEFAKAGLPLIDAVLAETALQVDTGVWGNLFDAGHGALTAHTLAMSPFGQNARLAAKDGSTVYWRAYQRLVDIVACGGAVASGTQPIASNTAAQMPGWWWWW